MDGSDLRKCRPPNGELEDLARVNLRAGDGRRGARERQ